MQVLWHADRRQMGIMISCKSLVFEKDQILLTPVSHFGLWFWLGRNGKSKDEKITRDSSFNHLDLYL